ncbi:MAG: TetR/AcrR family transcriptional regulator [Clostridia bacterium]|nr:TetR/AcrR family transcriptional regulator [Clostridia bacterium]
MEDKNFKAKIKQIAVDHFDKNGYYGTTIRNIASEAGCSLPMIYYYYKSKKELFYEIIKKDYFDILSRQAEQIECDNLIDFYSDFVYELNNLNEFDKKIYRLGIKVYLGFDGDDELIEYLDSWEKNIASRHAQLVKPHLKPQQNAEVIVSTLIHLLENLIESIIVKNRFLPKEQIRQELSIILADKIKNK